MSIAKQCKQLRKLNVSRCYGVTDRGVTALVQGCPLLTELDIGWCYKVSDQSLRLIPLHCSHFESIRIKGCCVSDRTLRALYAAKISVNNFFWVSSAKTFWVNIIFIFHPHSFISFTEFISFTLYMYLWFYRDFTSVYCVPLPQRSLPLRARSRPTIGTELGQQGEGIPPACCRRSGWEDGSLLSPLFQTSLGCMDWQRGLNSARTFYSTWKSLVWQCLHHIFW